MGTGDDVIPNWTAPGLTKRELFAAMAMQGMLAAENGEDGLWTNSKALATWCVAHTDALLAALAASRGEG